MEPPSAEKTGNPLRQRRGRRQNLPGKGSRGGLERRKRKQLACHYSMLIQWSDEDHAYIVSLPEFYDCKTHGETYEEAAKHGREVIELIIESYLDEGRPLPKALKFEDQVPA